MALRPSLALRNSIAESGSLKRSLSNAVLKVYSGAQPATAEAAPTGTLLCTYSDASGALTREVLPLGVVTLGQTGAGTGSVDTFTVNSLEIMGTAVASLATITLTTDAVVAMINHNPLNQLYTATNVAGVITLSGKPGVGALLNTKAISVGVTAGSNTVTQAITSTTFGSGTGGGTAGVTALNGLKWGDSAAGILSKHPTQTWSGVAAATGTAGWFRFEAAVTDAGGVDSTESILRLDGSIATSGSELNMSSTAIVISATQTVSSFQLTFPTA